MTHILVVDNNPLGRIMASDMLSAAKSEVTVATIEHGPKSLEQYRKHQPDLVLVDVRMTDLTGFETIFNLRALDRALPVLLTSRGSPVAFLDASDDMSSGVGKCDLVRAVRNCLARHTVTASASETNLGLLN